MRILIAHSRYRSTEPSGENLVADQERALLAGAGHQVELYQRSSDDVAGWSVGRQARLGLTSIRNPAVHRELRRVLDRFRPDVVHVHNTFPMLSPSVLHACAAGGVPVVATIHNYNLLCPSAFFRDGRVCHDCIGGTVVPALAHGCYRDSRLATLPVAVGTLVNRPSWRELVSAYVFISAAQRDLMGSLGLPADRTFVKHNFVTPAGPAPDGPRRGVVFSGRLVAAKGAELLMQAWDLLLARGVPDPRLLVVGSGPLEGRVRAWAATRPSVVLTGQMTPGAARAALVPAVAVVVPSQWEEAFGLVAVEAMAAGIPPIAPAHGSFTELITDGVDGVLFDPARADRLADVLTEVHESPDRFLSLGKAALSTYEDRFTPDRNLERLEEIYRYAIANPQQVGRSGGGRTP